MRRSARWKGKTWPRGELIALRSSQARRNAREILNAAAAMLHPVEGPVGSGQKLFGRVAVLGESRGPGAGRQSGRFRFGRHFCVDAADSAGDDVRPGFCEYDGEFVTAVARRGVNRPAVIAKNFAQADQGP